MKVVALGGAGSVGAAAVDALATLGGADEIVVADRDHEAVRAVADRHGAHAVVVDATDPAALRGILDDADVVLNTAGPFYRQGPSALRVAIETRTHYLDVCDDWEPTLEMLAFDSAARRYGEAGASPHVNVGCRQESGPGR